MSLPRKKLYLPLLIIFGGIVILAFFLKLQNPHQTPSGSAGRATNGPSNAASHASPDSMTTAVTTNTVPAGDLGQVCAALRNLDATNARMALEELRARLSKMPANEVVALIRQFLDSKADAATHLGFKIANNGLLTEAPTLRTFLLDELARLDPAAAAAYAQVILAAKDSPDEWAVALRNLARGDDSPDGRKLLADKTGEMLQYTPWQQNPSAGFLEAFDAAVYLGGTGLLPVLTSLARQQDNPAVAHASYLALDRLVISDPTDVLGALLADMDSMQGRELTRADYFARADVGDARQRQIVESYLLSPQITPAEVDAFVNTFPNANYMISDNLLTQSPTTDRNTLVSRDVQSLSVVQQWLADPRFAQLRPELQKSINRLQGFVQQAASGR